MLARNRYEVAAEVKRVVAETLSVAEEGLRGETLVDADLNATSMDIVALAIALDDAFGVELDLNDIPPSHVSMDWITNYILSRLST